MGRSSAKLSRSARRASSCNGKRAYDSARAADEAAMWLRREQHERVGSYLCKHCRLWHVGGSR